MGRLFVPEAPHRVSAKGNLGKIGEQYFGDQYSSNIDDILECFDARDPRGRTELTQCRMGVLQLRKGGYLQERCILPLF